MTEWVPKIGAGQRNPSQAIVHALAGDIVSGALRPGQRLPTHRQLAFNLGVAIATVTKAYAEARARGYVRSVVGNGTFVIEPPLSERRRIRPHEAASDQLAHTRIDLSFNAPVTTLGQAAALTDALRHLGEDERTIGLLDYKRPWAGSERCRQAGAAWLRSIGLPADPEDITMTCGAQHAASVALLSSLRAGDVVLADELTDPQSKLQANTLGLDLRSVPADESGMHPDALEAACCGRRARGLLCMPDHHSPTLTVMPEGRRRALAEIARRYELLIFENAVYRPLLGESPPPLTVFAPERSFFFSSFSKIICPGLRIGFLAAPPARRRDLILGLCATSWMSSPLIAEIATTWIESGTAARLAHAQRLELHARNQIAARHLGRFSPIALPSGMHLWLGLPAAWRADAFVRDASARGVSVLPSDAFAVGHVSVPHKVRVSIGGSTDTHAQLEEGLAILAGLLLAHGDTAYIPS